MAVKQQGRKKTKDAKRRKSEKKHQPVRQKQKKLQSRKLKKRQSRLKRQAKRPKAGTRGQERRICSPHLFTSKILCEMPKVRMEARARSLVKTMLTDMYNHVATRVETSLSQKNEPSAISGSDVQTALKEAMTKELAKHMAEQPSTAPVECT
ncbi:hypothetical protein JD844_013329 [Phrynosoma platyrhinos]|uniref:Histone H2B n=1 Tax=Phrynosoma platyrhinos TaxID=52577 RepID=A0ABQ7TLQ8_PHRPL|nr:hypothetical protein JD844_013329 [Phrynosoma platyrhinos]